LLQKKKKDSFFLRLVWVLVSSSFPSSQDYLPFSLFPDLGFGTRKDARRFPPRNLEGTFFFFFLGNRRSAALFSSRGSDCHRTRLFPSITALSRSPLFPPDRESPSFPPGRTDAPCPTTRRPPPLSTFLAGFLLIFFSKVVPFVSL